MDLPDPIIEEVDEAAPAELDAWSPDFAYPENLEGRARLDSRRWLVLPDRYVLRPLRAMEAAKAADALAVAPYGAVLISAALRLRALREGTEGLLRSDPEGAALEAADPEAFQAQVDYRVADHASAALEEVIREARGSLEPFAWALAWCERCKLQRVPLPSRREGAARDPGGLVHQAKGVGEWTTYYQGRAVHLLRLGAACAWLSLAPFFCDLASPR